MSLGARNTATYRAALSVATPAERSRLATVAFEGLVTGAEVSRKDQRDRTSFGPFPLVMGQLMALLR